MKAWADWKIFLQCTDAASKSEMLFKLGAVLVKGGKVISTGHNHHRTHYDGNDVKRKPVSMHAEMHAIFNACVGVLLSIASENILPHNPSTSREILHSFYSCSLETDTPE